LTASTKGRRRSLVCSQKTGRKGPDAVRRSICSRNYKEDPLTQIVRMHQHNISSAILQKTQCLMRELQTGTRQIKHRIAEKTKERWRAKRIQGH